MGRKVLLPVLSASCRVRLVILSLYCGTSFQHALYRLMRNLLKITRRAAGVNGAGTGQGSDWAPTLRRASTLRPMPTLKQQVGQAAVERAIDCVADEYSK